jgi:hypothetical protein
MSIDYAPSWFKVLALRDAQIYAKVQGTNGAPEESVYEKELTSRFSAITKNTSDADLNRLREDYWSLIRGGLILTRYNISKSTAEPFNFR